MNERIKLIRKTLGMSQQNFGDRICITKSSVSCLESGKNNPSDQTIKLICQQFNINEDWLRNGTGGDDNMFKTNDMLVLNNITINDRILILIKKMGMTKTAFAKKLNVSQQYISKLVKTGTPSELLIKAICQKFNVNENWLRNGIGVDDNMFMTDDILYLNNTSNVVSEQNKMKKQFLNIIMGLPDEFWDYIYKEINKPENENVD